MDDSLSHTLNHADSLGQLCLGSGAVAGFDGLAGFLISVRMRR